MGSIAHGRAFNVPLPGNPCNLRFRLAPRTAAEEAINYPVYTYSLPINTGPSLLQAFSAGVLALRADYRKLLRILNPNAWLQRRPVLPANPGKIDF